MTLPVIIPSVAACDEYGPDGGSGGHDLHHSLVAVQDIQSVISGPSFIITLFKDWIKSFSYRATHCQ